MKCGKRNNLDIQMIDISPGGQPLYAERFAKFTPLHIGFRSPLLANLTDIKLIAIKSKNCLTYLPFLSYFKYSELGNYRYYNEAHSDEIILLERFVQ